MQWLWMLLKLMMIAPARKTKNSNSRKCESGKKTAAVEVKKNNKWSFGSGTEGPRIRLRRTTRLMSVIQIAPHCQSAPP